MSNISILQKQLWSHKIAPEVYPSEKTDRCFCQMQVGENPVNIQSLCYSVNIIEGL